MRDYLHLHIIRGYRKEMFSKKSCDSCAILVRDKPHGNLRMSNRRQHRLGTFAYVSAPYSVYIKARTDTCTLQCGVSCLALDLLDVKELLILIYIERSA